MKSSHFQKWGAVYILFLLFLGSWLGQAISQGIEVANDAKTHGEVFTWSDYWPQFISSTLENWQSEFLQLAFQSILIASVLQFKIFRADISADKEDVGKIMDRLDSIEDRLNGKQAEEE